VKITPNRPYRAHQLGIDDPDHVIFGIYVGGCIDERTAWRIWEGARSHAHNHSKSDYFGWICILKPSDVLTRGGKPTVTLLHEVAHINAPDELHGRKWKREIVRLGIPQEITNCGLTPL